MKCATLIFGVIFSVFIVCEVFVEGADHIDAAARRKVDVKGRKKPKKRCFDADGDPPCKQMKREYKYYPLRNVCERVKIPWCKGDGSMFNTMEKCVRKCVITEQCYMPPVTGPCRAYIPSYYYNHKTGRCEMFIYGGCGGNANRFATEQECINTCVDPCYRDMGMDKCKPKKKRYTYDHTGDECVEGCGGGKNKFKSLEECEDTCIGACSEKPADPGTSTNWEVRYTYITGINECVNFYYGGSGGNENNFLSLQLCRKHCVRCKTVYCFVDPCMFKTCPAYPEAKCISNYCNGCNYEFYLNDTVVDCDPCILKPKDPGPCKAAITRYSYNSKTRSCEVFTYGGCFGNDNNFASESDCHKACIPTCKQPSYMGPCEGVFPSYFYNSDTEQCESFSYGGCDENDNRFDTEDECKDECSPCEQPIFPGPCKGSFPRYGYNPATGQCESFTYGGCDANGNNFLTVLECQTTCVAQCDQPPVTGPCKAHFTRYFFNTTSGQCETFVYGGCQGNDNRFNNQGECESTCIPTCEQPVAPGPCKAHFPRYYYNPISEQCELFIYGGCQGNDNRFSSYADCIGTCILPECPTTPVSCLIDPCDVAQCPAYPGADCFANYCGGCNAVFYQFGNIVDCSCTLTTCLVNPCDNAVCSNHPAAQCRPNYCLCKAEFYLDGGIVDCTCTMAEVVCNTDQCTIDSCPAYPAATCINDNCGGCNVYYYVDGMLVDCTCKEGVVQCAVDPCDNAECVNYPNAQCAANYCGGCNAEFYMDGQLVNCVEMSRVAYLWHTSVSNSGCDLTYAIASITTPVVVVLSASPCSTVRCENKCIGKICDAEPAAQCRMRSTCAEPAKCCCHEFYLGNTVVDCKCTDGEVQCTADPCKVSTCPAYPNAQCISNFCGGCHAYYYVNGILVNCTGCDGELSLCKADPCEVTKCTDYPNAICVANYCGGCNADFYVGGLLVDCGEPVCMYNGNSYRANTVFRPDACTTCECGGDGGTPTCRVMDCARPPCENPVQIRGVCCPVCPKPGYCPSVAEPDAPRERREANGEAACQRACTHDQSCEGDQKCCSSNGCGDVCMDPQIVKPGTCPSVNGPERQVGEADAPSEVKEPDVGICVEECTGDQTCEGEKKCCSNGCGHVCMDPEIQN